MSSLESSLSSTTSSSAPGLALQIASEMSALSSAGKKAFSVKASFPANSSLARVRAGLTRRWSSTAKSIAFLRPFLVLIFFGFDYGGEMRDDLYSVLHLLSSSKLSVYLSHKPAFDEGDDDRGVVALRERVDVADHPTEDVGAVRPVSTDEHFLIRNKALVNKDF